YLCLGCGKDLDKGEKFCPGCGKENPGHNPMADQKIPANEKAGSGEGRVLAKGKSKKKGGKMGKQTPEAASGAVSAPESPAPTPAVSEGVKEAPEGGAAAKSAPEPKQPKPAKPRTVKKAKGKKKAGKKMPPWLKDKDGDGDGDGDADKAATPILEDPELQAAYRLKALGVPLHMGVAHDLTCPA